jgi:uncharacterized phiE125 gp8 family phage protein
MSHSMRSGPITVVTPPSVGDPVITLTEAKLNLRVSHSAEDALITRLIAGATIAAQHRTGRQLVTATLAMKLDCFPGDGLIVIERVPLQSVTSITYVDDAGATQTLAGSSYVVDTASEPARVCLAEGAVWPITDARPNAVTVTFVAGYGAAAAVPDGIKDWMHLHIGALYRHREMFAQGLTVAELPGRFTDGMLDAFQVRLA